MRIVAGLMRPEAGADSAKGGLGAGRYGWIAVVALSLLYLSLATHDPVSVLANASDDDQWNYLRALSLAKGHWLGRYSQLTLMKGPGYPFFLAANFLIGAPVTLTQALFHIAASLLFARAIFSLAGSQLLGAAVFFLLLFHPAALPTRLIRDDIYLDQALLYFAALIHALFLAHSQRRRILWAFGAGLALAWLWVTREEGVWILPPTAVVIGARLWKDRSYLKSTGVLAGVMAVALALISVVNFAAYRTWSIVDLQGRSYANAVNALQSVRVGEPIPYTPVPAKVRAQVYEISPTFATLKPYFESYGRVWTKPGCAVYPSTCGDYAGGWFVWAFRDAVASTGHYASASDAAAFYDRIAGEVQTACRTGRLVCRKGLVAFMPSMTSQQWATVPAKVKLMAEMLLGQTDTPHAGDSEGDPWQLDAMWRFEGLPRRTRAAAERTRSLSGWFYGPRAPWIQLRCPGAGSAQVTPVAQLTSTDLSVHFGDARAQDRRFSIKTVPDPACAIQLAGAGPQDPKLSYTALLAHRDQKFGGGQIYIDSFGADEGGAASDAAVYRVIDVLARLLKAVTPVLAVGAAVAWLVHLVQIARGAVPMDGFLVVLHALWLGIACRAAILILIDLSAFPGIVPTYVAALIPLTAVALLMTLSLPFRPPAAKLNAQLRATNQPLRKPLPALP